MCPATSARPGTSAVTPASLSASAAPTPIPRSSPTLAPACRHSRCTACASFNRKYGRTTRAPPTIRSTSKSFSTGWSRPDESSMNEHPDDREGHDHGHPHPGVRPDGDDTLSYYQVMEIAVRELLIEKGVVSADAVRREVEKMDARSPAQGARVVARAWSDPAFKAKLLELGNDALLDLGLERGPYKLVVVENTADVHNMVVCTL